MQLGRALAVRPQVIPPDRVEQAMLVSWPGKQALLAGRAPAVAIKAIDDDAVAYAVGTQPGLEKCRSSWWSYLARGRQLSVNSASVLPWPAPTDRLAAAMIARATPAALAVAGSDRRIVSAVTAVTCFLA
jgi:hypothetical protein